MNPVRRFFRRYVLSTVGLLALLLAANILLIVGLLLISEVTPPRESFSITAFCGHLSQGPDGWQAAAQATAMLDPDAWAMVLDPEGNVVWEYRMPQELARHYSAGAVAMFSRWDLEDWAMTGGAQAAGVTNGTSDGTFAAARPLTWQEAAVFLVRTAAALELEPERIRTAPLPSVLAEGAWDRTSLELAWGWGLLPEDAGASDGITRAQGTAMAEALRALL